MAYSYDRNGNRLSSDTLTNTWDAANRLVSSSPLTGQAVSNLYDGNGNRVGQTVGGITQTNYALDAAMGLAEVIFTSPLPEPVEGNGSGQGGHKYLHLPGVVATEATSGTRRYLLSDGLGSVRHVTDEAGEVVSYHEFDPYGVPLTEPAGDPYGFTGEWWQQDIGLLHLRARWYDPGSGTFLSVDPVESEPPYQYVRGNPVNFIDPSGMVICDAATGYCPRIDRYLCSHTQGAYDHRGMDCIVNPDNLRLPPDFYDHEDMPFPRPSWPEPEPYGEWHPPYHPPTKPQPFIPPGKPTIGPPSEMCRLLPLFPGRGYSEGLVESELSAYFHTIDFTGSEVAYSFPTLERGTFRFDADPLSKNGQDLRGAYRPSGYSTDIYGIGQTMYAIQWRGFDYNKGLDFEFSGRGFSMTFGVGLSLYKDVGFGGGKILANSPELHGTGDYQALGFGRSPFGIFSGGFSAADYRRENDIFPYVPEGLNASERHIEQMKTDIMAGLDSPWPAGSRIYSRNRAVTELEEAWQKNRFFYEFEYSNYQPLYKTN